MPPRPVTCLLVLLFLFMSSYYLGHWSFSPWYSFWYSHWSPSYSHSGNLNCRKGFLLIVCTVMLKNYYEGKIVKLYIWERLFVKRMHQKKVNAEMLCKIWFVIFFRDYLVVWPIMMGNKCFMIAMYICICMYIYVCCVYIYLYI